MLTAGAAVSSGNSLAETVQPSSPYAMKAGWGQGVVGRRTAQKQGACRQGGLRKLLDRRLHLAAGRRRLESPLVDALRATYDRVTGSTTVCARNGAGRRSPLGQAPPPDTP